jgi:hypothetical protein
MKPKINVLVPLLLASLVLLHGQTIRKRSSTGAIVPSPQQIAETIQHLESELRIATMKGDASWFEQHLAPNYADVDAQGKVSTREEVIQFYGTTQPEYETWNLSEGTALTFNADTVILSGKVELDGTIRGQHVSGSFRYIRVWIRQGLDWQLAAQQATRIPG